jgi:surface carbohydrate biosynthesis protein
MDRIFLPIEIKAREFHSKILFSLFAAEYGYEVILGGQLELCDDLSWCGELSRFGHGLYIDKSTAITRRGHFRYCRSLGNNVAAWNEEGLIYLGDDVYHATRMDKEAFDQTDVFFAWGPHEARTILNRYPDAAERVVQTGNPRMDLLRPKFREYCAPIVDALRKQYGSIILINTNFPFYNFFKGFDAGIRAFDHYPIAEQHEFKSQFYEFSRKGYEGFMDAVPEIRKAFPDHTIVIRPAPVENADPWIERFKQQDRTVVTKEGNAVEWIQAADAVIQFNCTTGIETFLLGVPAIAYRCVRSSTFEAELPNACSLEAFSLEELITQLRFAIFDIKEGRSSFVPRPDQQVIIDEYISRLGGRTACEQILDVIRTRKFPPQKVTIFEEVPLPKKIWRSVLRLVRRPIPPIDIRYDREKFPGLTVQEVRDIADRFSNAVSRFDRVRITSAGHNIVRISS